MAPSKECPNKRRKLKNVKRTTSASSGSSYSRFNIKEKQAILQGLKEYGGSDLNKLASIVQTKSAVEIGQFIHGRKRRYTCSPSMATAPIDLWLDKAQRHVSHHYDFSKGLAEVFSNCIQHGYHDVYKFFIHLLKCETPPELNAESGSVLLALLDDLATLIKSLDIENLAKAIQEYQKASSSATLANNDELNLSNDSLYNFYKQGVTGAKDEEDLVSFNPLNLPPSFLKNVYSSVSENIKDFVDI